MNGRLIRQTLRWQRIRLLVVVVAAIGWGVLIPIIYDAFSDAFSEMVDSGLIPRELMSFGSGSLFDLPGAITLGVQHPLAIAMVAVFGIGAAATAVAGEREAGTLEVLLARPVSRLSLYASLLLAFLVAVLVVIAAILAGMVIGAAVVGVGDEIDLARMPLVALNGFGLWAAFTTFALAASVSFNRSGPAIGIALAYLLLNYFLEILGSLWAEAAWTQEYSLFHRWDPGAILVGDLDPIDLVIVFVAAVVPIVYAIIVWPRRDLPAPA